jgi:hypothetical protein
MEENKKEKCCICKKEFIGYGNNAWPIEDFGRCCDKCNYTRVIPERINKLKTKLKRVESQSKRDIKKWTTNIK